MTGGNFRPEGRNVAVMKDALDKMLKEYDLRKSEEAAAEEQLTAANRIMLTKSIENLRQSCKPILEETASYLLVLGHVTKIDDRLQSDSYPQLTLYFQPKPKVETSRKSLETSRFSLGCFGDGAVQFIEVIQQQYGPNEKKERLAASVVTSKWLEENLANFVQEVLRAS
jgi:hypothetical protein